MSNFRHADDPETRIRSFAVTFPGGDRATPHYLAPPHSSDWHQLVYAVRGVIRVTTQSHAWSVPPHRAVWIPGGLESSLQMHGEVALRMLYVRAGPRGLLRECAVVNVTPLLRELIVRANRIGALDDRRPEQARLDSVVVDELRDLRAIPLQLPLPSDARAARFAALVGKRPEVSPPLHTLARQSGASRRTLERIFREETGLSLGQWLRRQLVLHALAMLGSDASVDSIADELGYSSSSAFIAMFRKELGQTPARYLSATEVR
jgi:AraC-like DNA-binding protein